MRFQDLGLNNFPGQGSTTENEAPPSSKGLGAKKVSAANFLRGLALGLAE